MTRITKRHLVSARTRTPQTAQHKNIFANSNNATLDKIDAINRVKRRPLITMLAAALAIGAPCAGLQAMNIHVNGSQIVLSGEVVNADLYVLADVVDRLRQQGRNIDTLIMRNSRGGSVYAGYDIGDFARRNHLTTVVSGYCISACSMMYVGGSTRGFAADQPLWNQYIGIHGQSLNNKYLDSSRGTSFYDYFVQAIVDGDLSKTDAQLLDDAFSDHGSAVAYLYDPGAKQDPSVYWCHTHCDNPKQYKAYPADSAYNLHFTTQQGALATSDTLTISKNTSGNVNPNYYNAYDPVAEPYANQELIDFAVEWNFLAKHLAPEIRPVLTSEAFLDDIEVQQYNRLSPDDRKRLLVQYTTEWFMRNHHETFEQFQKQLLNPESGESSVLATIRDYGALPFVDPAVLSVDNAYGLIKVTNNATWTLGQGQRTAADALLLDHGRLHLDGGVVNSTDNYIYNGGSLEGSGFVGESWRGKISEYSTVYVRDGGTVHPTGNGMDFTGELNLGDNSVLALDVSPGLASGPAPLRFGIYGEYDPSPEHGGSYSVQGWLNVASKSALLALNVAPGFYRPGQIYNLLGYSIDLPLQIAALKKAGIPVDTGFMGIGRFNYVSRANSDGYVLPGYRIDLSSKEVQQQFFHPFDDSLLSYRLQQSAKGIWLQANDPFTDSSLCGNRGCGLGTALSSAAQSTNKAWEPLLGALEFSTPDEASHAAKQLRGEGYGSLRTSTLSLLGTFGTTLNEHLRAVDPGADQAAQVALAAGAYGMGLNNPRHAGDLPSMMRYLVASDDAAVAAKQDTDKFNVWGRVFGQRGRLDSGDGADGLRQHSTGVMFGLDRKLNAGTVLGGSVGYGKLRADGEDGSGFRGKVQATDARLYVDHRYDHGYLDASVSFTHLRNSTTRSIQLPLYSAQAKAQYGGNAWSLHFEHGKTFQDHHGVMWQPILPSIDVTRLPAMQFVDRGAGPANLQVSGKRRFDPRVGVGLQVAKSFAWGTHGNLTPHARLLFQHRFINNENEFVANLQGDPTHPFDVASQQEDRNHTLVNAGLSARRGEHTAFMLDYNSDYSRRHHDQGVMLGVSHRW